MHLLHTRGLGLSLSVSFKRGAAIHPGQALYHANKTGPEKRSSFKSTVLRRVYSLANGGGKKQRIMGKAYTAAFLQLHTAKLNGALPHNTFTPNCRLRHQNNELYV